MYSLLTAQQLAHAVTTTTLDTLHVPSATHPHHAHMGNMVQQIRAGPS